MIGVMFEPYKIWKSRDKIESRNWLYSYFYNLRNQVILTFNLIVVLCASFSSESESTKMRYSGSGHLRIFI